MIGSILRRWNWLEEGAIPLVSAAMRAAWLAPLIHLILNNPLVYPQGTRYPFGLALFVILGAWGVQRAVQDMPGARGRVIVAGLVVALCVAAYLYRDPAGKPLTSVAQWAQEVRSWSEGIPPTVLVVIATTLLWAYGLIGEYTGFDDLWRDFIIGTLVLVGLLLIPADWMPDMPPMSAAALSFLLWGLLGLAFRSVADALAVERERRGAIPALNRYWLAMISAVVLAILAGAWLLANTIAPQIMAFLLAIAGGILRSLGQLLVYVATALFYLFFQLFGGLFDLSGEDALQPPDEPPQMPNLAEQFREIETTPIRLPVEGDIWRYLLFAALAAGLVLVLYYAWRRRPRRRRGQVVEHREYIGSGDLFWQQLRSLWRRPRPVVQAPYIDLDDPEDPRQAIRRLYQRLLQIARGLGRPRRPGQTPGAYRAALTDLVPDDRDALDTLTDAYIQARYAPDDPSPAVVGDATAAFDRLSRSLGRSGREQGAE